MSRENRDRVGLTVIVLGVEIPGCKVQLRNSILLVDGHFFQERSGWKYEAVAVYEKEVGGKTYEVIAVSETRPHSLCSTSGVCWRLTSSAIRSVPSGRYFSYILGWQLSDCAS